MITREECRRRADDLLRQATNAQNMKERSNLIDEAMVWHNRAVEAPGYTPSHDNDDASAQPLERSQEGDRLTR